MNVAFCVESYVKVKAKMTGVDDELIDKAESLMNDLVVTVEEHGHSFYAPAPKKEKEKEETAEKVEKKPKKKSWAGLLNTGPKYAGRKRDDEDPVAGSCKAIV